MAELQPVAPVTQVTKYTALMNGSVARLVAGEPVNVPDNIKRHAFKNTPEEAGNA